MSDTAVTIRMAQEADAEALLAIYAPYVGKTAITFEYEVPTVQEFKNRIASTLKRYRLQFGTDASWDMPMHLNLRRGPPMTGLWRPPSMCPKTHGAPARAPFSMRHWKTI